MSKEETEQTRYLDADGRRWDLAEPNLTLLVKGGRNDSRATEVIHETKSTAITYERQG